MADTRGTLAENQALLADNVSGDITPQVVRDFLVSVYPDAENVMNHGAAGDGVADDQPEIAAAITAAGTGGVVYFPPGTYLLTTAGLDITTNNTTLILDPGATVKANVDDQMLRVDATGVSVIGGVWDGDNKQTSGQRIIIFVSNADDGLVQNTVIKNAGYRGLEANGASNVIFRNNRVSTTVGTSIYFTATSTAHARNILIEGNYIATGSGHGIQGHSTNAGFDVSRAIIVTNHIELNANEWGIEYGAFSGDVPSGAVISNNTIKALVAFSGGISSAGVNNISVTGNVIDSNGFDAGIALIEITTTNKAVVDGNVVIGTSTGTEGIRVNGGQTGAGGSSAIIISNNVVDGFPNNSTNEGGIRIDTTNPVDLKRVIVESNILLYPVANAGTAYPGIFIRSNNASNNTTDIIVRDNILFGNGDTAVRGIVLSEAGGTVDRVYIKENHLLDLDEGIRRTSAITGLHLLGNIFSGVTTEYSGTVPTDEIRRDIKQPKVQAFADNDLTPSVLGGELFKTANTTLTTITDLDDMVNGDVVRIIINDAFTKVDFTGSNLKGNVGVDWSPTTGDHMTCVYDGTSKYCSISDNTA